MTDLELGCVIYLTVGFFVSLELWRLHKKENWRTEFVVAIGEFVIEQRPFPRLRKYAVVVVVLSVSSVIWPIFLTDRVVREIAKMRQPPKEEILSETRSRYAELPPAIEDLGPVISIEAIEAQEIVHDPLNAVPGLPFGHLYQSWRSFKARHPQACGFQPFEIEEEVRGCTRRLAGYALTKRRRVIDHFVCEGY